MSKILSFQGSFWLWRKNIWLKNCWNWRYIVWFIWTGIKTNPRGLSRKTGTGEPPWGNKVDRNGDLHEIPWNTNPNRYLDLNSSQSKTASRLENMLIFADRSVRGSRELGETSKTSAWAVSEKPPTMATFCNMCETSLLRMQVEKIFSNRCCEWKHVFQPGLRSLTESFMQNTGWLFKATKNCIQNRKLTPSH